MSTLSNQDLATRTSLYRSLTTATVPILTLADANDYLQQKSTPNSFFPSCSSIAARSIALTNSIFYVKASSVVPGQQGLFTRRPIARQRTRLFVGFYLGWLHSRTQLAPFDTPTQTGTYSLEAPDDHIITPADVSLSPSAFSRIFPLARANEWIWDPSKNLLTFDSQGRCWLHCPNGLSTNTEVFVCLGLQDNYSWDHYLHSLYQRTLASVTTLACNSGQQHWADHLQQTCQISTVSDLTLLRSTSTPSYGQVLLGLVLNYQYSLPSATLQPTSTMTLLSWLQQLTACAEFSDQHTFRKADSPLHTAVTAATSASNTIPRRPRACAFRYTYSEISSTYPCPELCDQLPYPLALSYQASQLPILLFHTTPDQPSESQPSTSSTHHAVPNRPSKALSPTLTSSTTFDCPSCVLPAPTQANPSVIAPHRSASPSTTLSKLAPSECPLHSSSAALAANPSTATHCPSAAPFTASSFITSVCPSFVLSAPAQETPSALSLHPGAPFPPTLSPASYLSETSSTRATASSTTLHLSGTTPYNSSSSNIILQQSYDSTCALGEALPSCRLSTNLHAVQMPCLSSLCTVNNHNINANTLSSELSTSFSSNFPQPITRDISYTIPSSKVTQKAAKISSTPPRKRLHKTNRFLEDLPPPTHKRRDDTDDGHPPSGNSSSLSPSFISRTLQNDSRGIPHSVDRSHTTETDNSQPSSILLHHHQALSPPTLTPPDTLRVTYINVNSLNLHKFMSLLTGMKQLNTDVLCLLDTRVYKDSDFKLYRTYCKEFLGPGSSIHFASASTSTTYSSDGHSHVTSVGGQILIKSPRILSSASFYTDPSACGVVASLTIHVGSADILILSTYCPTASSTSETAAPGALLHKLSRYLDTTSQWFHVSPIDYILELVGGLVTKHHTANSCGSICGGDFNSTWHGPHPLTHSYDSLSDWASLHHLHNAYDLLHLDTEATYIGPRGPSIIDHVLCRGNILNIQHIQVCHSPIWEISDHWPLTLTLVPTGWDAPYVHRSRRRKQPNMRKPDIKRPTACITPADHKRLQRYQLRLQQRIKCPTSSSLRTATLYIQRLTEQAVKAARHTQRRTTKGPDGWSPETVALNLAKTTLLEISRRLLGTCGRTKWANNAQATRGIQHLCDVWNGHLQDLSLLCDADHAAHIRTLLDHGPTDWINIPFALLLQAIRAEVKKLGKLLHGRRRAELQLLLRTKDKMRAQARIEGKQLKETRKLLDKDPMYWELDELLDDAGNLITNASILARKATAHFATWHARKSQTHYGFHDPHADHLRLLTDCDYFIDQHHTPTGIPTALLRTLWTSLQEPLQAIQTQLLTNSSLSVAIQALESDPSLDEFLLTLKSMPSHSAPGPSGLTYNMIISLPTSHLHALYNHLLTLWKHKHILPTWKWRELAPLPKVLENITINDIRPLTLIETCRKVWVSIFVNRIKHFWLQHNIIHPSQHAYTAHRGVDTVHPQHRNLLEEARETCSSVYYTSWDIRRAFDRVAKPILVASWIRTGVPTSLAQYLVEFDTDGFTFVGTPYTRDILSNEGLNGFSLFDDDKAPCFQAQVGTGQGDVASPFNWNSFFDILLRALATVDTTPLYVRSTEHLLHPTEDSGFADDLISISAKGDGLQQKADIVSAFSIVFGLDIATQKLRAVQIHWGHENSDFTADLSLAVHHGHWTNTTHVPLLSYDHPQAKAIKYLGVLFDYDNSGRTQLDTTIKQIERDFQALHRKYSRDPLLKLEIAAAGILSKARYAAKFSSWNLRTLHEIDAIFARHYRRLLLLLQGFPEELLYAPKEVGGHGLTRFSDAVNGDKHSLLHRSLDGQGATRQAMLGLLHRAQRQAGAVTRPGIATVIPHFSDLTRPSKNNTLWASSLIEWLAEANLHLSTGGSSATGTELELLQHLSQRQHLQASADDLHFLHSIGLHTLRDVVTPATSTAPRAILCHPSLPLTAFQDHTLPPSLLTPTPILTPQQSWSLHPYDTVIEPLGWISTNPHLSPTQISYRKWVLPPHLRLRVTTRQPLQRQRQLPAHTEGILLDLSPDSHSLGAGTHCSLPFSELFPPSSSSHPVYQVILSTDVNKPRNQGVARTVLCSYLSQAPLPTPPPPSHPPLLRFDLHQHRDLLLQSTIYTDASLSTITHPLDKFFHTADPTHPSHTVATASVVFQPSHERTLSPNTLAIRIVDGHLLPKVSAFLLEALAIVVASKLRKVIMGPVHTDPNILPIHSDCKGVISLINGSPTHLWKKPAYNLIRSITRDLPEGTVHWVRSHVERRSVQKDKWTSHECGNHLADSFASDHPPPRPPHHHLPTITITATQVLQQLLREEDWLVVTNDGLPFLGDPTTAVKAANWKRYIDTRDQNRMQKGHARKWSTLSLRTAAILHRSSTSTYTQCSRISKLIYDWYHHGSRAVLGAKEMYPDALPCQLCQEPDSQFHLICGCTHPVLTKTRTDILTTLTSRMNKFDPYSPEYKCMYAIRTLAQPDSPVGSPHYVWIGTWSPQHIDHLRQALQDVPCTDWQTSASLIKVLKVTCTALAEGTREIIGLRYSQLNLQARFKRRLYRRAKQVHRSSTIFTDVKEVYAVGRRVNTPNRSPPSKAIQHLLSINPTHTSTTTALTSTRKKPLTSSSSSMTQHTLSYFLQPNTNNTTSSTSSHFTPSSTKVPNSCTRRKRIPSNPSTIEDSPTEDIPDEIPVHTMLHHPSLHGTRYTPTPHDKDVRTALHKRRDYTSLVGSSSSTTRWPTKLSDLLRLLPVNTTRSLYQDGWLSDTNISSVSELYNQHSPPPGTKGSYLAIDGLFFSLLYNNDHSYTYERARTWFHSSTHSPLHYDTLYIPTNLSGQHWTGLIIDTTKKHVMYYDSLGDINFSSRVLYYIKSWLQSERLHLLQHNLLSIDRAASLGDPGLWTYQINPPGSPQQTNGYDCGVFYLATILYHIQGRTLKYTQQNIPLIRQQLVAALLSGSIPNPHVSLSIYDNPYDCLPFYPASHRLLLSIPPPPVPELVYVPNTLSLPVDLSTDDDTYELDLVLHGGGFYCSPPSSSHWSLDSTLYHLYYPP